MHINSIYPHTIFLSFSEIYILYFLINKPFIKKYKSPDLQESAKMARQLVVLALVFLAISGLVSAGNAPTSSPAASPRTSHSPASAPTKSSSFFPPKSAPAPEVSAPTPSAESPSDDDDEEADVPAPELSSPPAPAPEADSPDADSPVADGPADAPAADAPEHSAAGVMKMSAAAGVAAVAGALLF